MKSKGLLSMMLSLPEDWNYTTRGLAKICKEGTDSIGSALKELERAGYIGPQPPPGTARARSWTWSMSSTKRPHPPEPDGPCEDEPDTETSRYGKTRIWILQVLENRPQLNKDKKQS